MKKKTMKATSPSQNSEYTTDKLALAAFLVCSGASQLVRAYCQPGGRVVVFQLSPHPDDDQIAAFFSGMGKVSALEYHNTLSNLKSMVFEAKRLHNKGERC